MAAQLTQADIAKAFDVMGVTPIERDIRQLKDLMAPVAGGDRISTVFYRTVLANGTGKLSRMERADAELERNAL